MKKLFALITICFFSQIMMASAQQEQQIELVVETGHTSEPDHLWLSSDAANLISRSSDKIIIWDLMTESILRSIENAEVVGLSPNEQLLATLSESEFTVWDIKSGERLYRVSDSFACSFSPTSEYLVCPVAGGIVHLRNSRTGKLENQIKAPEDKITSFAFGAGDRLLVNSKTIFNLKTLETERKFPSASFSRDGKLLEISDNTKTVKVLEVENDYQPIFSIAEPETNSCDFSASSKYLKCSSGVSPEQTVAIWDIYQNRKKLTVKINGYYSQFSPDDRIFLYVENNTIYVFDLENEANIFQEKVLSEVDLSYTVFSPNNQFVGLRNSNFNGGKTFSLWDIKARRKIFATEEIYIADQVKFTPDSKNILIMKSDLSKASIWDVKTGTESVLEEKAEMSMKTLFGPRRAEVNVQRIESVFGPNLGLDKFAETTTAFSSGGEQMFLGFNTREIEIWDYPQRKKIKSLKSYAAENEISFEPNGNKLKILDNSSLYKFWDFKNGGLLPDVKKVNDLWSSNNTESSFDKFEELFDKENQPAGEYILKDKKTQKILLKLNNVYSCSIRDDLQNLECLKYVNPDDKTLNLQIIDIKTGRITFSVPNIINSPYAASSYFKFTADYQTLAYFKEENFEDDTYTLEIIDVKTKRPVFQILNVDNQNRFFKFSSDNKTLIVPKKIRIDPLGAKDNPDTFTKKLEILTVRGSKIFDSGDGVESEYFNDESGDLLVSYDDRLEWHNLKSKIIKKFIYPDDLSLSLEITQINKFVASPNRNYLVFVQSADQQKDDLVFWNTTANKISRYAPHSGHIRGIDVSPDNKYYLTGGGDGFVKLWKTVDAGLALSIVFLEDNGWVVTTPDGRFDTNKSLDNIKNLHWVLSDALLKRLPLEVFMRQYFEPGLYKRTLDCLDNKNCDSEFSSLPSISEINRVQPKVSIKEIKSFDSSADITVEVENVIEDVNVSEDRKKKLVSGVYDLRLFRDGQLVGTSAQAEMLEDYIKNAPQLIEKDKIAKTLINTEEDKAWREANDLSKVVKFDGNKAIYTFKNIRLPKDGRKEIEFSAYAFNADRVKSETARQTLKIEKPETRDGNVYLISIGVNASQNPAYNLSYAANDARETQKVLGEKFAARLQGTNSKLIQIPLISDYSADGKTLTENTARKNIVKGVFALLAGKPEKDASESLKDVSLTVDGKRVAPAQLPPVEPEDTLIIAYSGHGYASQNGIFYLLPYDIGETTRALTPEVLPNLISSDELSLWMLGVTAKDMLMIIDACHSAAAVQGDGFKPGPMGSRGLGQLAYDKGMKILSATQADNVALELGALRQGLLSYALLQDGINKKEADIDDPKDNKLFIREWLRFGERRVPALYREIQNGVFKGVTINGKSPDAKQRAEIVCADKKCRQNVQQPKLFDFNRQREDSWLLNLQ